VRFSPKLSVKRQWRIDRTVLGLVYIFVTIIWTTVPSLHLTLPAVLHFHKQGDDFCWCSHSLPAQWWDSHWCSIYHGLLVIFVVRRCLVLVGLCQKGIFAKPPTFRQFVPSGKWERPVGVLISAAVLCMGTKVCDLRQILFTRYSLSSKG